MIHNFMQPKKCMSLAMSWCYQLFRYLVLLGISYVVLYPVLSLLLTSITLPTDLFLNNHVWIPKNPTFTNFTDTLKYFRYTQHAWISAQIAIVGTVLTLVSCSLVGYGLARYRFKGNMFIFMCVILTIIVPTQTAVIPTYVYYQQFDFLGIGTIIGWFTGKPLTVNLLDTMWVYYFPATFASGLNSGLFIFLFRQFFRNMPRELEDAGRVDGCNPLSVYIRIILPNTKPVFVTVALLSCIFYWNDTLLSGRYSGVEENFPILHYIQSITDVMIMRGFGITPEEMLVQKNVMILLAIMPLILVFLFCQKFFIECMDRSGVKG